MKIAIIASGDYYSDYGGGQKYVKNLVHYLYLKKHGIIVFSAQKKNQSNSVDIIKKQEANCLVFQISFSNHLKPHSSFELQEEVIHTFKKLLQENQVQVIHANGWKTAVSCATNELKLPLLVTMHHGGLVCPAGALLNHQEQICQVPANQKNCLKCSLTWSKVVRNNSFLLQLLPQSMMVAMGSCIPAQPNVPFLTPALKTPFHIQCKLDEIEVLKKNVSLILAPSRLSAEALYRNGFSKEQVNVLGHGIEDFEKAPLGHELNDSISLVFVGRLNPIKGLHLLLEACQKSTYEKNIHLHVIGEASSKKEINYSDHLKNKYHTLNINWLGHLNKAEINQYLKKMHVLCFPSICVETFGLAIAEALAVGLPVIASKCGGADDQIISGENGFLVEPNQVKPLQLAIEGFLQDPSLWGNLRKKIKPPMSFEEHVEALEKYYQDLISL